MTSTFRVRFSYVILAVVCACSASSTAFARKHNSAANPPAPHYFVEFLARPSQAFGHSFVRLGVIDEQSRERTTKIAGFYPVDKTGQNVFNAPGIVTSRPADKASQSTAKYRVLVSENSYLSAMKEAQKIKKTWVRYDLVGHNCNHLVGAIARNLGLAAPSDYADLPENYVHALQARNAGRERASWKRSAKASKRG